MANQFQTGSRKMAENEGPVSDSVVNEPAKLSVVKASEQDDFLLQSRPANLECPNVECRKREEEITRLSKELSEEKRKRQESEKQGHKMTNLIHLLLNDKQKLKKKSKYFEDVADGAKRLECLELKKEDEKGNSTHVLVSNFVRPFNCNSSCVLCVVFFIFQKMNINICTRWFVVKMRIDLGEIPGHIIEVGECTSSLKDLYDLCLIERCMFFKKDIDVGEIGNAFKYVKTEMQKEKYPALLVVKYGMKSMPRHCLAVMPTTENSEHVEIYDVQKNEMWDMDSKKVKSITEIGLYKIDEKQAKAWEINYISTKNCKVSDGVHGALNAV